MQPLLRVIVPAFLLLAFAGIVFGDGSPLSLATDVGVTDEDACSAIRTTGPLAVERLESTNFPHATPNDVEVYELQHARTNEVKARIIVDWVNNNAACQDLTTPTPAGAVVVRMNDATYASFTSELRHVILTGETSDSWGNYLRILTYTQIDGAKDWYKMDLAKWAAGIAGADA